MEDFRKEFPVINDYTYLNTASCGLLSRSLVQWRHEHDIKLMEGGSVFRDTHKQHIIEIRSQLAGFFSTSEDTVALVPNFSFGMNTILEGLAKGLKILLLKGDYPSINWPVEFRSFEVCYAEIDENLESNIERAIAEHRPDVFAFSYVQYISGILIDTEFLSRLKAYHPELLLISDATQFLGTTDFNFTESPIDVMGASAYKWLLAGYGNGLFMIKPEAQSRIHPKTIGFNSADATFGNRDRISFVGRMEPGHQDTLNYGSLAESVTYLEKLGMDTIEAHLNTLIQKAKEEFIKRDLLEESVTQRERHSTIFNLKADKELSDRLKASNIICSLRGKGIRVSFHFYNSLKDLDALLAVIDG
ncbi:MAG: aminotransferase class V-fold PLP-dependent enzyme [Bacteroidia bacterium]|nr:aminotransferase class V-fold PLP-dependent enzyme [Bacteroidia bacterium]NNF29831.1 aminotransferase class V-fold PLP-dependent enzyme [Flavobacteriaceae bacterium]MBT8275969.1 aminotransferase class V-fold PLP-dependent enzyme [Bacteroidia bacterium]NNJ82985.1 aminotransferase class V-fold PLP-dependent enzyme [Flavobacteriaceae bacterium]NNK53809.1 aminotransferase class V-fold PLP-dependent enzyme [Flavobacteriaceae bacterium]